MKVLAGHTIPCYNRNISCPVMPNCSGKKPEKLLMRPWLIEQVEKGDIPGLKYLDEEQTLIQIPWTHGSRHGWEADRDACLFKRWDIHTGRYSREEKEDPKRWKATFRNAIHSLPDVKEVKEKSKTKGIDAFRVFKLCEEKERPKKARRSSESDGDQHFRKYATHADRLERFRKLKKKASLKKARTEDDRQQSESDSSVSSTSSSFEGAQNTAVAAAAASQISTDCQQNSQWFGQQPESYYQHSHLSEEVMDMSEAANTYHTLNLDDF